MNPRVCDGTEFGEWSDEEEDDIVELLPDLGCGLDDWGDLEDIDTNEPNEALLDLQKLVAENSQEL